MAAIVNNPGAHPGGGPVVGNKSVKTEDLMKDKRYQPSVKQSMAIGVGKAHRQVVYYHYEMRNYRRGGTNKSTV